jgi:hypothetical protein
MNGYNTFGLSLLAVVSVLAATVSLWWLFGILALWVSESR